MKSIYTNGKIYVEEGHFEEACVVEEGFFTYVGNNKEALQHSDALSKQYDLQGKTVVPGFNDAHLHFYMNAQALMSLDLSSASSVEDVLALAKQYLKEKPDTNMLIGRGYNQDYFTDEKRFLLAKDLDAISTEIPILFYRACGHVVSVNTKAMQLTNITSSSKIKGGLVHVHDDKPTGVLSENARLLLDPLKQTISVKQVKEALTFVSEVANAHGITSVATNDLNVGSKDSDIIEKAYQQVALENPTVRVYHQICFKDIHAFNQRIKQGYDRSTNAFNRYGPLKLFTDGSLGARTAFLKKPYHDDPSTKGIATLTQEELNEYVITAHKNNIQVAAHAIGDGAMDLVLNSYESLKTKNNDLRHGIIHCQITDEDILNRSKECDIIAYVQPIFLHYDLHIVEDRVGKLLAKTSYAFKSMDDLNMHVAYSSDAPIEPFNVMHGLHCAINNSDLNNTFKNGFNPDQKVNVYKAIDHFTIDGAYASFEEDIKGRIKPGYYADFVVLNQDIFTINPLHIKDIQVDMTFVNGQQVYKRQAKK